MRIDPNLIACPMCDTLHRFAPHEQSRKTRCVRCGYRLTLGQPEAIARVVGLALTSVILMGLVVFAPFLSLSAGSFGASASVVDVVLGFASGIMTPLALAVLGFIVVLPVGRAGLLLYALVPILTGRPTARGAEWALRWAFLLKPWAMAEIFMLGVAVALVKLAGMARIEMGPAFYAFALLVLINALQDTFMCRNTLWSALAANTQKLLPRHGR